MQYSTIGFIESLEQEKHGLVTYLIDGPSDVTYGWIFKCGPLVIVKIKGWEGEEVKIIKFFSKEIVW
jgi:hypothetical protein